MIKEKIERIIRMAGARVCLIGDEEKAGWAVIYPLISETDFGNKEIGAEAGSIDIERFAMISSPELVDKAERGDKVICRGESYVILGKHIMPYGENGCYAHCFLRKFME